MRARRVAVASIALAFVIAGCCPSFADAQRWTFNDVSADQLEDILDRAADALSYERSVDGVGRPMWNVEDSETGLRFKLYMYDDDESDPEAYESILARSGFGMPNPPTIWTINGFNQNKRFSRAFLNDDGDPIVEADLDLFAGVTEDVVLRFVMRFIVTLSEFAAYIGYL